MRTLPLRYYLLFSGLCLAAFVAALVLQQLTLLVIPFAVVVVLLVCHQPHLVFYALIASIPWSIEYNVTPSLGTDLPDEPLMLLTCFSAAAFLLANAKRKPLAQLLSPLGMLLLLQVLWYVATIFSSTNPALSLKFLLAKSWYLGAFVITPFFLFKEKKHLKRSALILFVSMMVFTVIALIRHNQYGFTFGKINDSLQPFFRNHVNYSALLVCMAPLLVLFYKSSQRTWMKVLLRVLFPIMLLAIVLSYARGAWLALIVGGAAYWLLKKRWLFRAYLITFALVFVGLFWLIRDNHYLKFSHDYRSTIFHTDFREHLVATYELKDVSTAERFYRWIAGVRMVKDNWMTGYGPNTFYHNYKAYGVSAFRTWVSENDEHSTVHNYFLMTTIEQGFVGLFLLLLLIGYAFYKAEVLYWNEKDIFWRRTAAGIAAILAMLCTVNFLSDLVETDKVGSVFYSCIGTLLAMIARVRETSKLTADIERIA